MADLKKGLLIDIPTFRTSTHQVRTNRHSYCTLSTARSQVRDNREYLFITINQRRFEGGQRDRSELTAEGPRDIWNMFGESEIGNLDVTVGSKEDVFGFEIAVDDIEGV